MVNQIVGLGAGGHAKGIIEILNLNHSYELVGLLDPNQELQGLEVLGVPVLGGDALLPGLMQIGVSHFFVGLGGAGDNAPRQQIYEMAIKQGLKAVEVIHLRAIVSPSANIGEGGVIMAGAVVNASAIVGKNVIVNTNAVVEHDCKIGNHVHIATGAQLASTVQVADAAHIGAGATVRQCISIGENAIIGAGAVVVKNVSPNSVVVGVPAKEYKKEIEKTRRN